MHSAFVSGSTQHSKRNAKRPISTKQEIQRLKRLNQRVPAAQRVLEAACDLFSEGGLRGIHLRDISRRAGAKAGAIRCHFHSKQTLYEAVSRKAGHQLAAQADWLEEWLKDSTPEAGLKSMVDLPLKTPGENRARIAKLAVRELIDTPEGGSRWVGNGLDRHLTMLLAVFRRLMGHRADIGAVRLDALGVMSHCLFYSLEEQSLHRAFPQPDWRLPIQETLACHISGIPFEAVQSNIQKKEPWI